MLKTITTEEQRQAVLSAIGGLKLDEKKPWDVSWVRHRSVRSNNQNNLYWAWIEIISKETGNDRWATHEALKDMFCPQMPVIFGEETRMIRTTAKLQTEAMSEYIDKVQAFVTTELGIILPARPDQEGAYA